MHSKELCSVIFIENVVCDIHSEGDFDHFEWIKNEGGGD